jgi:NAD(P)-dependent dehydrogenase (short-subunit alcohol dehydrogenase family)
MESGQRPVALVTGAGRGIGRATAEAFGAAGYAVVIAERTARLGRSAERALRLNGAPAVFVRTDVAAPGAAERAVRAAVRRFGRLDCVVNNAGVLTIARLDRLARRDLEAMVRVNLVGPLLIARAALPILRRRRRGEIVNVASLLGKEGAGDYVTYCATKFGVIGLTEALADELRGTGVVVWAVCPGQVDTAMGRKTGVTERDRSDLIAPESVARVIVSLVTRRRRKPSGASVDVTR